ncbi:MAG TPA: thermonuclease family protein [Candidatus Omnitrophota bacterium]|jgi:hypothetical protein|nr:thermonuclease family protein [Candidatus Omnitrophota bacterium]
MIGGGLTKMFFRMLWRILFLCLGVMLAWSPVSFAELITDISAEGVLTLEDGKRVTLAGVVLDAYGMSILRVLAHRQNANVDVLREASGADGCERAYVYLKSRSLDFPFAAGRSADERDMMLNEFLLRLGAARVDESQTFSQKKKFLLIQEEASRKGEGIWSYVQS